MSKESWNHVVVKEKDETSSTGYTYTVCEQYTTKEGRILGNARTPYGDTKQSLRENLVRKCTH